MTVIFFLFFFAFLVGVHLHITQNTKEPDFSNRPLLPQNNFHTQRETFLALCDGLLGLTKDPKKDTTYYGMLDEETSVQFSQSRQGQLALEFTIELSTPVETLELKLDEHHAKVNRGQHPQLLLPINPGLNLTPLANIYLASFQRLDFTWRSQGRRVELHSSANMPEYIGAHRFKEWIDQIHELFKRSAHAIERQDQPWTQVAFAATEPHPLWSPALLYMAATEQTEGQDPAWRALLARDAQYWHALPPLPQVTISFEDEPGELLGRAYPHPPQALMNALARRGELERMWEQGTLPVSLGAAWFEQLSDDDPLKPQLVAHLDAEHRARHLIKEYPLIKVDSIPRLSARLNDPQDPFCAEMTITLEALGLWTEKVQDRNLLKLLADLLRRSPALEPKLSTETLLRLLNEHPTTLRGPRLKELLKQLTDIQFADAQHVLMTRTEPWTVFEHTLEHPSWRAYVLSNSTPKSGWRMVAAMLRDKSQLNEDRLHSIATFLKAPIQDEEQARTLREYFLVAQEIDLHKQLWKTLLNTMKTTKAHQDTLQLIYDRWEPLIMAQAFVGGLTLSEDDANAGALSVVNAEQGSLTLDE